MTDPNTHTPPSGEDEQQHTPPGIEDIIEPSERTQADVRSAEEMLVQKLLGVDLRAINLRAGMAPQVARLIVQRASAVLIQTRDQVSHLGGVLGEQILAGWTQTRRGALHESQPRLLAEVVMEAVRSTFPAEVVRELIERLWPTMYRQDPRDYPLETRPNELVIPHCSIRKRHFTLIVDTDHPIWKQTNPTNLLSPI